MDTTISATNEAPVGDIEFIDATEIENPDTIKAYYFLISSRGWDPKLTMAVIRAADDIVDETEADRVWALMRVAERIGIAVSEITHARDQMKVPQG